ncbi:ACP phosphodiesterase [Dyella sp.]|jgi:acyl carrier protein phosphodiesterase|uniref:acyl carrier protein phosphodiesterase n=1 Tax=Dyella sp. TaxID=1869338 RepID=UPI002D779B49|nr:ACP phosphodiesterase [Dyella sp.]HET6431800.1 ACP phosphodiesterase [Dyella sp.]
MNHLAHALLAGDDDALRLGGLLGDFVRGSPDDGWPPEVVAGIRLHRAIDVYTDAHPQVLAAKARLAPPYRRYAGILLDMWFDHCLARDFPRWAAVPLADFSGELRGLLADREPQLPPALRRFLAYMHAHDLPAGYARSDVLGRALAGIGQRLQRSNPLADALPVLQAQAPALDAHFEAFFPELQAFAAGWIARATIGPPGIAPTGIEAAAASSGQS